MGLLTFSINVTLDGCVDHQEGIADDETVEGRPAVAWIRREDEPLARGEVNMEWLEYGGKDHTRQERRWVPPGGRGHLCLAGRPFGSPRQASALIAPRDQLLPVRVKVAAARSPLAAGDLQLQRHARPRHPDSAADRAGVGFLVTAPPSSDE